MGKQQAHNLFLQVGSIPTAPTKLTFIELWKMNMRRKNFDEPHGLGISPEGDLPKALSDWVFILPVLVVVIILAFSYLLRG